VGNGSIEQTNPVVVSLGYLRISAIHPPFSRYNEWIFTN